MPQQVSSGSAGRSLAFEGRRFPPSAFCAHDRVPKLADCRQFLGYRERNSFQWVEILFSLRNTQSLFYLSEFVSSGMFIVPFCLKM